MKHNTQMEVMQKMHTYAMGNQDFNKWYQVWSTYARQANVNDKTKMFAFRKLIPGPLHNKLLGLSPPPATLNALVKKARDFNTSWRMFAGPKIGYGLQNPRVQEIKGEDALSPNPDINAVGKCPLFKKRGHLSPQERKHCMDKNLCLYCGEAGHKAINCTKPPNCHPGGSLCNMETIHEEEKEAIYPTNDTMIGLVSINSLAPLDYIKDSTITNFF